VTLAALLLTTASGQKSTVPQQPQPSSSTPPPSDRRSGDVSTSRQPPSREGHDAETNPGQQPHGSGNGAAIAAGAGAAAGAVLIGELIAHHNASPEHVGHTGPQVPKELDMSGFSIKGIVGPNWPIVLDFMLGSPGSAQVEITSADKHHIVATLTNPPSRRAYGIFHLPADFGSKPQTAVFQVRAVPATATPSAGAATPASAGGANASAPGLRVYGIGAGERAVGSVAIDQLTFQPAMIHPKAKEVATFGFHTHSFFDGVRAEFVLATLYNGHILVQQDQEQKLSPVPEGERAKGTWEGKGKAGQHMLQVRAWRGLENGGDWVVAWSPDIVDVVK
jgi:hypothetical protein